MISFDENTEFEREFKKLFKKYKTLDDDFEKFKKVLLVAPTGVGKNFVIVHSQSYLRVVKARMACRFLRKNSLRIIYAYLEQEQRIEFIELYFKGDKENEDRDRIKVYLKDY